uniref:Uncharacterized protein n=1 Tax=Arundo donax TaxID=35708 RepID=A0A0A9C0W7_ARUDO
MASALVMEITELERMKNLFICSPCYLFRWSVAVCVVEKGEVQLVATQLRLTYQGGIGPQNLSLRHVSQDLCQSHRRFGHRLTGSNQDESLSVCNCNPGFCNMHLVKLNLDLVPLRKDLKI